MDGSGSAGGSYGATRKRSRRPAGLRMDPVLRGGSRAQPLAAEIAEPALPPPEPAALALILELSATSAGQLTLF